MTDAEVRENLVYGAFCYGFIALIIWFGLLIGGARSQDAPVEVVKFATFMGLAWPYVFVLIVGASIVGLLRLIGVGQ